MSLKTHPSFSIARCTLRKLDEAEIIDIAFQKQKLEKWKLEHEKLDAERDYELKTLKQNYKTLLEVNTSTTKTMLKLRSKLRKLRTEQRGFFEWLESEAMSSYNPKEWFFSLEKEEYEEKKKAKQE